MCPPGCLHSICENATRRGLLKAGFTLGLGAMAATAAPGLKSARAEPLSFAQTVDMSHALYEGFPTFGGDKWFTVENIVNFAKDKVNLNRWTLMEHTGTHMDAPIHFSADGMTRYRLEFGWSLPRALRVAGQRTLGCRGGGKPRRDPGIRCASLPRNTEGEGCDRGTDAGYRPSLSAGKREPRRSAGFLCEGGLPITRRPVWSTEFGVGAA